MGGSKEKCKTYHDWTGRSGCVYTALAEDTERVYSKAESISTLL